MQSRHDRVYCWSKIRPWVSRGQNAFDGTMFLPWLAFAVSNCVFKHSLISAQHSETLFVRAGEEDFLQNLTMMRADLLLAGLVLPTAAWCCTAIMTERWRKVTSGALALFLQLVLACELVAYNAVGAFLPMDTLRRVGGLALSGHDWSLLALPASAWLSPVFWTFAVLILWVVTFWMPAQRRTQLRVGFALVTSILVIATSIAWLLPCPQSEMNTSLLQLTKTALWQQENADTSVVGLSLPELLRRYRVSSHSQMADGSRYWGAARGYNVLLFVIESTPADVVDPAHDDLSDLPNLAALRRHAFVAEQHYTPYPLTNRALFAMFTSMYIQCAAGTALRDEEVATPGLVRALRSEGYMTAYYGFVWHDPRKRDDRMYASLRFEKVEQSSDPDGEAQGDLESFFGPVERVKAGDEAVLQRLRQDLRGWAQRKQPFFAAFLPQIGHDPWRELHAGAPSTSLQRGRALVREQDAWLGLLVNDLKSEGLLDHTIIVFTSDHGVRREIVKPGGLPGIVSPGRLDRRTLQVPLLIYVPRVLAQTVVIKAPTSHIDLQPTLLDVLGIRGSRDLEQGLPVWNPSLKSRRLFMATAGAEGFCCDGRFYMKTDFGSVCESPSLQFSTPRTLGLNSDEASFVKSTLADHDAQQHAILRHVLQNDEAR